MGDTGPIHIWPDPFSPHAWKGAGDETIVKCMEVMFTLDKYSGNEKMAEYPWVLPWDTTITHTILVITSLPQIYLALTLL